MGHERLGVLPRTRRWRDVVERVAGIQSTADVSKIVQLTLDNVSSRLKKVDQDSGVNAAFGFLVGLAVSTRQKEPAAELGTIGVNANEAMSLGSIAQSLDRWVSARQSSPEYAQLAKGAALDALAAWCTSQQEPQQRLFAVQDDPYRLWRKAGTGAGFCELARLFFSRFTERHLKYFLDREAAAVSKNLQSRDFSDSQLRTHVEDVSQFAFETSKITQSFAAGWFNKHASEGTPSQEETKAFLARAFGKLREELWREARPQ